MRHAKPDRMAEKVAHRPPRCGDRGLAAPVECKPGAMGAGHPAAEIGDGCDHRRPALGRTMLVRPVEASRMEAQRSGSVQCRDAAVPQVRFHDRARHRLRHGKEPACRLWRSRRNLRLSRPWSQLRLGMRKTKESPGLIGDVLEVRQTATLSDDVEQIAVFASGGVGPLARGALAGFDTLQADEHRATRRIADVANQPVASFTAPVGEIVTADRLSLSGHAARQIGCIVRHRVLRNEKGPAIAGGPPGCGWLLFYSAAVAGYSSATDSFSVTSSSSTVAVSPPSAAISTPAASASSSARSMASDSTAFATSR